MDFASLNIFAILCAALISFALGGIWYSPLLFGKRWMLETGISEEDAKKQNMARVFGLAFLANLVIALNLAMFLGAESTLASGAFYGFLAGFGWVAMAMGVNDLFEQRSFTLYAINAGFNVVGFTLMGAIIGVWH
ncbi:DUF1761 domain-containing protein [Simiduia sp. 21SJ11W-1]|uniref:DUF1761 domain-containing protein n=1 Tax=Simiduia sp. 21SJ11W-1 TaxID=2909669 RepID=UPI0020A2096E|nr:DUF1761 domain-containing protein [Simiduia sp. 21SJ11W-1]UTA47112.1 DUF1761 domain-containing protein [Simiduia sp. 21SJ11W-1]